MKGKLTIIGTDASETVTVLTAAPELEQLQAAVGGSIEVVPYFTKFRGATCVVFCHEEGKLIGLRPNLLAQVLWERAVGRVVVGDLLVGPIAIITGDAELLEAL